ncbi:MAG: monofunctional biosynthetic peptidoglycan transglycosylase [Chitinophagaceae bacterium]|nr:monofunctional biosynthetic peptidoglycan transglycosylase [Chitinophagaceae bacterium]
MNSFHNCFSKSKRKIFLPKIILYLKRISVFIFFSHLFYIIILKWFFPPITLIQLGSHMDEYGFKKKYVPWNNISQNAKLGVIASEDQLFLEHYGFDWNKILDAIEHNQKKPHKIRGASTISQQVAKNVFLWKGRSWIRKGLETYFTAMIEIFWGKKRILEVYLNVSEMGKGIFGIEAASIFYFHKSAKNLTKEEAATIIACLPNPKKYYKLLQYPFMVKRKQQILTQMYHIQNNILVKKFIENTNNH